MLTRPATQIVQNEATPFEELVDLDLGVESIDSIVSSDTDSETDSDADFDSSGEHDDKQIKRHSEESDLSASVESNPLELPQTLELIRFIINCLYKMPIRRPAALERITERIREKFAPYQQFDARFVQDLHPELDPAIATRLGRLISLRRHIMYYQEEHNARLQPEPIQRGLSAGLVVGTQSEANAVIYTTPPSEQASGISRPSKATTHLNPPDRPDLQKFDFPPSVASSHHSRASTYAINTIGLPIPPMPKNADGTPLTHFLCPYCKITQYISTERAWKKHVLRDLKPYVCTFSGCRFQDHFFASRNAWYLHETQEHRCEWHCNVEGHDICKTQEQFISHMSESHRTELSWDQMTNLAPMFRRAHRSSAGKCNLCNRKSQSLCDHVARHLERIALFALPRSVDDDADSNSSQSQQSLKSLEALLSDNGSRSVSMSHKSSHEDSGLDSTNQASGPDPGLAPDLFEDGEELSDVSKDLVPDSEDANWDVIITELSQTQKEDTTPDASPESLLGQFFLETNPSTEVVIFTETTIREIARLLEQCSKVGCSRIPRIYIVLRKIREMDAIEGFIDEGITDSGFPFTQQSLPHSFTNNAARLSFLEAQDGVFNSEALRLERSGAEPCHFSDKSDVPLKLIRLLGRGGSAVIHYVLSTITHKEYALKVTHTRKRRHDETALRKFRAELRNMKPVDETHRHIVDLVGSKRIHQLLRLVKHTD